VWCRGKSFSAARNQSLPIHPIARHYTDRAIHTVEAEMLMNINLIVGLLGCFVMMYGIDFFFATSIEIP
jgi:hypothetical protein